MHLWTNTTNLVDVKYYATTSTKLEDTIEFIQLIFQSSVQKILDRQIAKCLELLIPPPRQKNKENASTYISSTNINPNLSINKNFLFN